MTSRVRTAVFGTGFMGRVHLEALRRVEFVEAAAVAGRNRVAGEKLAAAFGIPAASPETFLKDPTIDAIHIGTPNALHFSMAKEALLAGKHVVCEKPLAVSIEEAEELVALAAGTGLRNCVCHNLRYYPMVQQMRRMREGGELGEILVVQGTYSQDWLLYDTDWNWRVDARDGGPSRCMADIGSHWFDMAEHVTWLARDVTVRRSARRFTQRGKRPKGSVETFANKMLSAAETIDDARSIRKISARWCSAWGSALAVR